MGGSPLTDTLPISKVSPLHQRPADEAEQQPADPGDPAGDSTQGETPAVRSAAAPVTGAADDLPRRTPRITALSLIAFVVLALGLAVTARAVPASAAPCPLPSATPTGTATPTATTAAAGAQSGGNPILDILGGLVNGVKKLFGAGGSTPTPTATPSTTGPQAAAAQPGCASPTPTATGKPAPGGGPIGATPKPGGPTKLGGKPTKSATASAAPTVGAIKKLAVSADQPLVPLRPGILTTARLDMTGLSYDGVVDLPTRDGTTRALQFSMDTATNTPFELDTTDSADGPTTAQVSSKLEISGNVKFFTSKLQGNLLGLLPVTFTPDSPPPLTIPVLFFTNVTIDLVYVHADTLTADNLHGFNKS
jgi:hypothetical protein